MAKSMLFLVLGILAGAAGAYFVAADDREARDNRQSESAARTGSEAADRLKDPGAGQEPADPPRGSHRSLKAALDEIVVGAKPGGLGVIRGRITTPDGVGVANVVVRGTPRGAARRSTRIKGDGPPESPSLERRVRAYVRDLKRNALMRIETVTDGNGAYRLTGISSNAYRVRAWKEGHEVRARDWELAESARAGRIVDFVAIALVEVQVRVHLPDGSTPDAARIEVTTESGHMTSSTTEFWVATRPILRLSPGSYKMAATLEGRDEYSCAEQEVTLELGRVPHPLEFHLRETPGVYGRVIFPPGSQDRNYRVFLMPFSGVEPPDPATLSRSSRSDWAHEHQGFRYAFKELKPGSYCIGAGRTSGPALVSQVVEIGDGRVQVDLTLPPPDRSSYVVVHVFDPDGNALTGVTFTTKRLHDSGSSSGGSTVVRAEGGTYQVMHHDWGEGAPEEGLENARWFVAAKHSTFGRREVEYQRGPTSEVTIRYENAASLEVAIAGYAGSDLHGKITLSLARLGGGSQAMTEITDSGGELDQQGVRTFSPIAPGRYEVLVRVGYEQYRAITASATPTTIVPGKNTISVPLPVLYSLTVLVPGEDAGEELQLRGGDPSRGIWLNKKTDKEGRVVFEMLPAGSYTLTLHHGMDGQMTVTLPGPSVVTYKAQPVNALLVRISDPGGALAQAGFQDRDKITGVNGAEFEDLVQIQMTLMKIRSKKSAEFAILRNGATIKITMDPSTLMGNSRAGGNLEPTSR